MSALISLVGFIVMIGLLVFIHELGHFLAAKMFGVRVEVFSLGIGGRMFGFRWGETEYQVAWLPLGGYVKMLGEQGARVPPELRHRAFSSIAIWKRAIVILAGPLANIFVLPVIALSIIYVSQPRELSTVVGVVLPGRPALAAGLRTGDRIVNVDGKEVRFFRDLLAIVSHQGGKKLKFEILRDGKRKTLWITPQTHLSKDALGSPIKRGLIGILAGYHLPVVGISDPNSAAYRAGLRTWDRITHIEGRPIQKWTDVLKYRKKNPQGPHRYTVKSPLFYRGPAMQVRGWMPPRQVVVRPLAQRGIKGRVRYVDGLYNADLIVERVHPGTPMAKAGVRVGDRLLQIDEFPLRVQTDLMILRRKENKKYRVRLERAGEIVNLSFVLTATTWVDPLKQKHKRVILGIDLSQPYAPGFMEPIKRPVTHALQRSFQDVWQISGLMIRAVTKLFTRELSSDNIGGPLMMFQIAQEAVKSGWEVFLRHMSLLSINLGILNLLPIPILDGGHLFFLLIEGVTRRPVSARVRETALLIGLALLLMLMLLAFRNDIQRIFFS